MDRISFDSQQRPLIRDTGIRLEELFDWISAGKTEADIIHEHPCLEHDDFEEAYRWRNLLVDSVGVSERLKEIRAEVRAKLNGIHPKERA